MRCRAPVDALCSAENENDNDDDNDVSRWTRLCRHWGGHALYLEPTYNVEHSWLLNASRHLVN